MSNGNIIFIGKVFGANRTVCGAAPMNFHEAAWRSAEERVKNDPNLCIVPDIESGFPVVMTNERRQKMVDFFEFMKPKVSMPAVGQIFFYGTGGSLDENVNFDDLFSGR